MTRCIAMVLVAVLLVAAAPVPREDEAKKEVEKLQGTWKVVSIEEGGKVASEKGNRTVTFDKDTLTLSQDGEAVLKGTFKLDPSKKPKAIDVTITQGKGADKGKVLQGIYELDKDSLKWCTSDPGGKERPGEFSTKVGSKIVLFKLEKEKK
jgi:uncharacterized protein (TIGR03067 family)